MDLTFRFLQICGCRTEMAMKNCCFLVLKCYHVTEIFKTFC